ncbi:MAG: hypothetical protein ACREEM_34505 [Blastocatellia bacterium]
MWCDTSADLGNAGKIIALAIGHNYTAARLAVRGSKGRSLLEFPRTSNQTRTGMTQYYFKLERTSWKSQYLIYEEPGFRLVVDLEMSGVKEFDWAGIDTDFEKWTTPPGEPITEEKRREIFDRLADWSQRQGVRIKISPPRSMKKYFDEHHVLIALAFTRIFDLCNWFCARNAPWR